MQNRPDLMELIDSVRHFLETEVITAAEDPRLRFRARVAANVLAVASRERAMEDDLLGHEARRIEALLGKPASVEPLTDLRRRVEELNAELSRAIRSGDVGASPGSPAWVHLRQTAIEKLRVANPGFLKRVEEGRGQTGGHGMSGL